MTIDDFIKSLEEIDIKLSNIQLAQLEQYYELLVEWNNKINLTGITEKKDVYLKHFYDSLTLNKVVDLNNTKSLCDIGTGAGFPGMVIKIVFPNIKVTLVDSLNKRILFLDEVIKKLNLRDIETISTRAEEYAVKVRDKYDVVTARAVAPLSTLLEYSIPLVKINGCFVAMKSDVTQELGNIKPCLNSLKITLEDKKEFYLPVENSKRTLLRFKKNSSTPKTFPRKFSLMKKSPL